MKVWEARSRLPGLCMLHPQAYLPSTAVAYPSVCDFDALQMAQHSLTGDFSDRDVVPAAKLMEVVMQVGKAVCDMPEGWAGGRSAVEWNEHAVDN